MEYIDNTGAEISPNNIVEYIVDIEYDMVCEINNGFVKIFYDNGYYYPILTSAPGFDTSSPKFYFNRIDNGLRENYLSKGFFSIG